MNKEEKKLQIDIKYVANLARVTLEADELALFSGQLSSILEYINKLNEIDISRVRPTSHVLPLKNVSRKDEIEPSLSADEALKNAPEKHGNFFKVPNVIED